MYQSAYSGREQHKYITLSSHQQARHFSVCISLTFPESLLSCKEYLCHEYLCYQALSRNSVSVDFQQVIKFVQ